MTEEEYRDAVVYFLSFCIENYKNSHSLTGEEAMTRLAEVDALGWLEDNYEILHTQSHRRILEEIEDYIVNRQ